MTMAELLTRYQGFQVPVGDPAFEGMVEPCYCDVCGTLGDAGPDDPVPPGWISLFAPDRDEDLLIDKIDCLEVLVRSITPKSEGEQQAFGSGDS